MTSLIGCADSKTLKKDQYEISNQGNSFIVKVTDTDINAENIETLKVNIRYKYAVIDYGDGSAYGADFKSKTKTETFEVTKSDNISGAFIGGFTTENPVSEFECKKVVAYYDENGGSDDGKLGILASIGISVALLILCTIIWFILSAFMVDVNVAFYIAVIPYIIAFFGMLVTGQWIPALIIFIGIGAFLSLVQLIFRKIADG